MLKREWGAESNGKLPHLLIPGKNAALVPGSCACSEGPALGQNTLIMIMCLRGLTAKDASA